MQFLRAALRDMIRLRDGCAYYNERKEKRLRRALAEMALLSHVFTKAVVVKVRARKRKQVAPPQASQDGEIHRALNHRSHSFVRRRVFCLAHVAAPRLRPLLPNFARARRTRSTGSIRSSTEP